MNERLGLVGVERRRGDEVVVEPVEPVGQVVEQRALDLDPAVERDAEPLGVVAGVGVRALGEEDLDERTRALPLGGRGERGRSHLVGREAGLGAAPEHLGDDPGKRLGAALLRRPIGDVGAGAVATCDVARVGQASVDRPDRVGVHSERSTQLPHRRQSGAGQQPTGVDLVGELPVDLGRDRDVRVPLDVELPGGVGRVHKLFTFVY